MNTKATLSAILLSAVSAISYIESPASGKPMTWDSMQKTVRNERPSSLPESELLLKNDNLFPGQSRSQAMALEAETGHLTPEEDAVLIPMLRKQQGKNIKASSIYLRQNHANRSYTEYPGIVREWRH